MVCRGVAAAVASLLEGGKDFGGQRLICARDVALAVWLRQLLV